MTSRNTPEPMAEQAHLLEVLQLRIAANRHHTARKQQLRQIEQRLARKPLPES